MTCLEPGVAGIKPEYLKVNNEVDPDNYEPKLNSRGQNKRSKKFKRAKKAQMAAALCPSLWFQVPPGAADFVRIPRNCKSGAEKCAYNHDLRDFWTARTEQHEYNACPFYAVRGWCPYGLACLSAHEHVHSDTLTNMIDLDKLKDWHSKSKIEPTVLNYVPRDVVFDLAKRKYDFGGAKEFCVEYKQLMKEKGEEKEEDANWHMRGNVGEEKGDTYPSTGVKPLDMKDKLVLAPLTTVGNLPFRRICVGMGADVTCAEMCMSTSLLNGNPSEWALVKRHPCEKMFGIQICGSHFDSIYMATNVLIKHTKFDFLDLNLGCPIDLVCNKGGGCAMMNKVGRLNSVIDALHRQLSSFNIPLTVKMRTGISKDTPTAHKVVKRLRDTGKVSLFTLHGRSREQRYTKLADWQYINECAQIASPVPMIGCGDVINYQQYYQHMESDASSISGIMIARGALVKPWIFREIRERRHWDISSSQRMDIIKEYAKFGLEHWGSDRQGVEATRRFLLEWLSFLHRYIPVGILEVVPQQMNLKPQPYFGRDDLETLMASQSSLDWVKITEMVLGPTPENFDFVAKHKANSYG